MSPFRSLLLTIYLLSIGYILLLSDAGIVERRRLERELLSSQAEVERLVVENRSLEEKERLLKNDAYALEKEARRYYLLSETAYVLKFSERGKELEAPVRQVVEAQTAVPFAWQEPPLVFLQFLYIAFSVFLSIGIYWKRKRLPTTSKSKRLN